MKTLIRITLSSLVAIGLAACESAPKEATEQGSVIHTKADGSKVENRSDYADYANVKLKLAERPLFEMTCPPQGCVVASLKVNNPTSGADILPPVKPAPEPSGFDKALAVADRLLGYGVQAYGIHAGKVVQTASILANKEIAQSRDRSTVDLVDRIATANAQATGFITRPNVITTNNNAGRDLNTGGAQSNDNSQVANNCASGSPGAGGTASTQSPPPATGSQANAGSSGASGAVECRR